MCKCSFAALLSFCCLNRLAAMALAVATLLANSTLTHASESVLTCALADQIAIRLAPRFGIDPVGKIKCQEIEPAQNIGATPKTATQDLDQQKNEERVYKIIGLIPHDYPYASCMQQWALASAPVRYDRSIKSLIIHPGTSAQEYRTLLIHEVTHLLQDQIIDLNELETAAISTDQKLAVPAMLVGQALLSEKSVNEFENQQIASNPPAPQPHKPCHPPTALLNIFTFPEDWGFRFTTALEQQLESKSFRKALLNPPRTTREILLPGEFLSRLALKDPPKLSAAPVHHYRDTAGQYLISQWLKLYMPEPVALKAAKGWQGDRLELLKDNQKFVIRWKLEFTTAKDVDEFLLALRIYFMARYRVEIDPEAALWRVGALNLEVEVFSLNNEVQIIWKY